MKKPTTQQQKMDPNSNPNTPPNLQTTQNKRSHDEDRISELPDVILHYILTLMPMSSSMRTSVLSRRWSDLCRCFWEYTTSFDFGEDLYNGCKTLPLFVETVNRYLQFHSGINIRAFRLSCPGNILLPDFERWLGFALERQVQELCLDFHQPYTVRLPNCLFSCNSLTFLKLAFCRFNVWSTGFNGFRSLNTLHLQGVHMNDNTLVTLIAMCPVLENLTLCDCRDMWSIKICSKDLKLKRLTILDCPAHEIEIYAPNLLSFHFNGDFFEYSFRNISSLEDAIVTAVGPNYYIYKFYLFTSNRTRILSSVAHVRILTICIGALGDIARVASEAEIGVLPIVFPNLKELQLVMRVWGWNRIRDVCALFRHCSFPHLEKLFIQISNSELQRVPDDNSGDWNHFGGPLERCFYRLRVIKINGFGWNEPEIELVKFLLERAAWLETFVIVTSETYIGEMLKLLQKELLLLPKASPDVHLVVYEPSKDNSKLYPTHSEVYEWM